MCVVLWTFLGLSSGLFVIIPLVQFLGSTSLRSVGYNVGTHQSPLVKISEVMGASKGAVIVAYTRIEFPSGNEKGNLSLGATRMTTPWSHIEAALAASKGLPMLVLVENGIRKEGLIEPGHGWYVQDMEMMPSFLQSREFQLLFEEWDRAVKAHKETVPRIEHDKITVSEFFRSMKLLQWVGFVLGLVGLMYTAFKFGKDLH